MEEFLLIGRIMGYILIWFLIGFLGFIIIWLLAYWFNALGKVASTSTEKMKREKEELSNEQKEMN